MKIFYTLLTHSPPPPPFTSFTLYLMLSVYIYIYDYVTSQLLPLLQLPLFTLSFSASPFSPPNNNNNNNNSELPSLYITSWVQFQIVLYCQTLVIGYKLVIYLCTINTQNNLHTICVQHTFQLIIL